MSKFYLLPGLLVAALAAPAGGVSTEAQPESPIERAAAVEATRRFSCIRASPL